MFEREITWVEDPELLEPALNGIDTAARRQVLWQVRLEPQAGASCATDLDALFPPSAGRLTTSATGVPASDDPCILSPTGGYRGLENRLYRVEIHVPGPPGTAQFKWSRENASIVSPVLAIAGSGTESALDLARIGRDQVLRFKADDWVEVTDDWRQWLGEAGDMARIARIDEATRTVVLDRVVPAAGTTPFATDAAGHAARHTRLIRWDQGQNQADTVDATTGLMATGSFPIALEDGIQVGFTAAPGTGGAFLVGDHWSFCARTVDGSVELLAEAPPDGIHHVRVPLAVVTVAGGGITVESDCRNLVPAPAGERSGCDCCTISVGKGGDVEDLRAALEALPDLAPDPAMPVRICLLPGDHRTAGTLEVRRPRTRITGCFPASRLHVAGGLRFVAPMTNIEEVVVQGEGEPGMVTFLRVAEGFVRSCRFTSARGAPFAIAGESVESLVVEDNRMDGAGIFLEGPCHGVRLVGNTIERAATSAVIIRSDDSRDIEIRHNRLIEARGSGIELAGGARQLALVGNDIRDCIGDGTRMTEIAGGVVLHGAVEGLTLQDNRIENNAREGREHALGLYVAEAALVEISRNRITGNGRKEADPRAISGGIVIESLRHLRDPEDERRGFGPALQVRDNVVIAPSGPALLVVGEGDCRIQDNTLLSRLGLARSAGPNDLRTRDLAAAVLIAVGGLDQLAEMLISAGVEGPEAPRAVQVVVQRNRIVGFGQVLLQGNQIELEHQLPADPRRPTLAAVTVYGFTDVDLAHNQIRLSQSDAAFCADALVVAQTTRQQGNRFTERRGACLASLLSIGFDLNTCSQNQGSHCILRFTANKLAASDNLVEFPSALCREG